MRGATWVGDGPLWVILILVLLLADERLRLAGVQLAVALPLNFLIYKGLKQVACRPRPFQRLLLVERAAEIPDEFSFPSGHMAAASVVATVVSSALPSLLVPLVSLSLAIGASRVYLGMHYPSDVLVGALLGVSCGVVSVGVI